MSGFGNPTEIGVAQYLSMTIEEIGDGTDVLPHTQGHFPGTTTTLDSEGRLGTDLLTCIIDSIGGMTSGLASLPDWIVTTNLMIRRAPDALIGTRGTGPLTLDTQVLRRGRSSVVTRVETTDANGEVVATAWMSCAVLTPANGPPQFVRPVRPYEREAPSDPIFFRPTNEFFNLSAGSIPGMVSLAVEQRLQNPWGILHGGSSAVALDAAARSVVLGRPTAEATPEVIVTDLAVHYLSPGRVGPILAHATLAGRRGLDHLVRVEVRDEGAEDRLMVLAMVTVHRLD
ncbi:MAG: hotdog domain-containing protein [Acidimicrobiales bacterium]